MFTQGLLESPQGASSCAMTASALGADNRLPRAKKSPIWCLVDPFLLLPSLSLILGEAFRRGCQEVFPVLPLTHDASTSISHSSFQCFQHPESIVLITSICFDFLDICTLCPPGSPLLSICHPKSHDESLLEYTACTVPWATPESATSDRPLTARVSGYPSSQTPF